MKKTIRMNRKQFFVMMIVTPFFAAYTSILTLMIIFQPWKTETPLEVPTLGGIEETVEETTEEVVIEKPEEKPEEKPAEEKQEDKKEEKQTSKTEVQKSVIVQPKQTKQETKPAEKKETKTSESPKEEESVEKSKEEIAKETCEATKSDYKVLVTVHFFDIFEQFYLKALGVEKENPIVDYKKYTVRNGETAQMVYENGSCKPSKTNLELVEDLILDSSELEENGISAKSDYEVWE